ncbi:hypothetical protein M407DRAFT_241580 [Tulasnella calospora MUT 4182]|uniref:Uncharacterized protein n=1 Tax=Tulasnella calospora MUT 4182 TaxID=1051891 RepID=A0A0C3LH34_9AGAM|nr:hypothetical protein M407DRAFT_246875 [Tulasnella calospora MUT 4182]KIO19317.1 hypothetical protein M407DRAFT_246197 [Tulasnella calospora MUT 4182]KIO20757.1 hypothetical protein M407DRAFT_245687 [Tulasnella calospora MUT 4182]KIO31971.1 hypothetical protein M407DRAFT_241580 [Tulasnella calospora MUT 4182]
MVLYQRFTLRNLPTLVSSDRSATSHPPRRRLRATGTGSPTKIAVASFDDLVVIPHPSNNSNPFHPANPLVSSQPPCLVHYVKHKSCSTP